MGKASERESCERKSRREFVKSAAVAAAATGAAAGMFQAHAAGDDRLRVGLVGCGGRGTGAARQVLNADKGARLVAMADAFSDRLASSLNELKKTDIADQVQVDPERRFVGFDAYRQLLDSGVDVVLLATPPHFRPEHLAATVEAGKHVFAEKPVAVDAPGVRSVLETSKKAKEKGISLVSGLCWRYDPGLRETVKRINDGALGDVVALNSTRYGRGVWVKPRKPGMTDMQWQMRNWYYFTWLSGDFIVEQFIHELDKMAWVMQDRPPVSCYSTGGRQTRTGPEYGHIYDHFSTVFEYDGGVRLFAATRHQVGCEPIRVDHVLGTKGRCDLPAYTIVGANPWKYPGKRSVMHQVEQDAFLASIRSGEPINNGEYMAKSTLLAIMARDSAYTGKRITWKQALSSNERLGPSEYDWNMTLPVPPVPMPGISDVA